MSKSNERLEQEAEKEMKRLLFHCGTSSGTCPRTFSESELKQVLIDFAAQVEEEERERCCKDVCGWCESTKWGRAEKVGDHWIHQYENAVVDCEAAAIRERSVTRATGE